MEGLKIIKILQLIVQLRVFCLTTKQKYQGFHISGEMKQTVSTYIWISFEVQYPPIFIELGHNSEIKYHNIIQALA